MAILGKKIEWRYANSMYPCSVENCEEEVILVERWSGKRLCQIHASNGILSNAEKYSFSNDKSENKSFYI